MTLKELRAEMAPVALDLDARAAHAEAEQFAPWIVECLRRAAWFAALGDQAVSQQSRAYEHART